MLNSTLKPNTDLSKFAASILRLKDEGTLESTFQPIIDARSREAVKPTVKPQRKPRAKQVDKTADIDAQYEHAYTRLVAMQFGIMDALGDNAPITGYAQRSQVPTIAAVLYQYNALKPWLKHMPTINFGVNSDLYREARETVAL